MEKYIFLIFILGAWKSSFSQNLPAKENTTGYTIKGTVIDSVEKIKLSNSSIVIINAKDSILQSFTRADPNGDFEISGLIPGKFVLIVFSPDYAEFNQGFDIDSGKHEYNFGIMPMVLKTNLLKEVIIKGTASQVKIKGDTTEYNARTFKIQQNAKVEDLLKQLPGLQIDKNGKITAQGNAVNKVLVDGEEFFGDDPTLVTRNLRADMVDKIQIYDRKTDQAKFTGVDDGKREKTINVKLKSDKKNGYFGKLDLGVGTDGFYKGQALFNKFTEKRKISIYSIWGNDGITGLGWQDNAKYASSTLDLSDPGIMIHLGGNDIFDSDNGKYNGKGIPVAKTGGAHFDNKWADDKQSINLDYKIGSIIVDGAANITSDNNLPVGTQKSISDQFFHHNLFRQKLSGIYKVQFDSTTAFKVGFSGFLKNIKTTDNFVSSTSNEHRDLLNNSRTLTNDGKQSDYNTDMLFTMRLKEPGRTLSIYVGEAFDRNKSTGFLHSKINIYNALGAPDSTQNIDQYRVTRTNSSSLNTNVSFSEPLSKFLSVILNYSLVVGNSTSTRETFDQSPVGIYNTLDTLYSNDFKLRQLSNQGGAVFSYNKGRTNINFGTKVGTVNFKQTNTSNNMTFQENFTSWNPQASAQYKISGQSAIRLNYNGNTVLPTITDLQPVRINTDPVNIIIGNPLLKPAFDHHLSLGYNSYTASSGQLIGVFGNYILTTNPIVGNFHTDSTGKTLIQSVNLPSKSPSMLNFNIFYDRKIKPIDLSIGVNLGVSGNTYYTLTNDQINMTKSYTYSSQLRMSKTVPEKYDFYFSFGPTYTVSGSSLQPNINNNGNGFMGNESFTIFLPWKFQLSSNANYQYNSKTKIFDQSFSRLIINSSLNKMFLKQQNFNASFTVNDLLNQNTGFDRMVSGNLITQNQYTTIRRFFMISLTYDFDKVGSVK